MDTLLTNCWLFTFFYITDDKSVCPPLGDSCRDIGILPSGKCVQGVCKYGKNIQKLVNLGYKCSM